MQKRYTQKAVNDFFSTAKKDGWEIQEKLDEWGSYYYTAQKPGYMAVVIKYADCTPTGDYLYKVRQYKTLPRKYA